MKYAVGVEYSGTAYCGWQRQLHCESVQQNLEAALGFVADHAVDLVCAGRTDSGVHAIEQVAHFDAHVERSGRAWVLGANCRLPRDIRLKWILPVEDEFHARFSAKSRSYRYIICNSAVPSAIFHDRSSWEFHTLDHELMNECAQILVGEHDFSSFRAVGCQAKSAQRNIHQISVCRQGDLVFIDVSANAFLYHMVRNIAGSLIAVGKGGRDSTWFTTVFEARDRKLADVTAAAGGLYFLSASYEDKFKLPTGSKNPYYSDMSYRTRVKICGITTIQDALHSADMGADSIGLNFHPPSARQLDIEQAVEISRILPPFVTITALFLDESEDLIANVVHQLRPDCLQFHGNESAELCASWGIPYIKSIPMGSIEDPHAYARTYQSAQGFLFDSNAAGRRGGSGDTFDWSRIPAQFEHPLVLAGGITPANVAEAIIRVRPWGVDVSSGVEVSAGVKSADLIDRFFEEVKRGDEQKTQDEHYD